MSRLPFELSIPKPCSQQWSEMPGSTAMRHCASCDTPVHNLAALTPRQIERLIAESNGHFCGRISRKGGELITKPESQHGLMAMAVLACTAIPSSALAQSKEKASAVISGKVESPSPIEEGWIVQLQQNGEPKAIIKTDIEGVWRAEVPPGIYDLHVISVFGAAHATVRQFTLHTGEQSFAPIRPKEEFVTVEEGEIIAIDRRPWYKKLPGKAKRLLHLSS